MNELTLYIDSLINEDDNFEKAMIRLSPHSTLDIYTEDGKLLVGRFQPEDFIAVSDAIKEYLNRVIQIEKNIIKN